MYKITHSSELTWGSGESIEEVSFHRDLGSAIFYTVRFNTCIQFSASASLFNVNTHKTSLLQVRHLKWNVVQVCISEKRQALMIPEWRRVWAFPPVICSGRLEKVMLGTWALWSHPYRRTHPHRRDSTEHRQMRRNTVSFPCVCVCVCVSEY